LGFRPIVAQCYFNLEIIRFNSFTDPQGWLYLSACFATTFKRCFSPEPPIVIKVRKKKSILTKTWAKNKQSNNNTATTTTTNQVFDKLKNKPFWIWYVQQHKLQDIRTKGDCCFSHIVPVKKTCHDPLWIGNLVIYMNW
jgi:hypothetical protein